MEYQAFLRSKLWQPAPTGLVDLPPDPAWLFPFQADLDRWALRRGRAAIFAATGLGKMRMELHWAATVARHTGKPTIVLAPLAVAQQIVGEAESEDVQLEGVALCREDKDVGSALVAVTNYERLHRFDPGRFGAVVLDESSCIKHADAKTFSRLCKAFATTPFKLCGTATPAPNDYTELGTHAEFLGICTRPEMLAEYFCHDGGETQTWRLKGHARQAFWRWLATWGALVRKPSDLGYDDDRYTLPPLTHYQHTIPVDQETVRASGLLFAMEAKSLSEQRTARRASIDGRVAACAAEVNVQASEPWVVWCELNDESAMLTKAIPGAVEVRGSDSIDEKEAKLIAFARGDARVVVTKPSIAGWGVNWQHCAREAFVGVTNSWEATYQAVRRCWRFGQKRPVDVHVYASEAEGRVIENLKRKELDAAALAESLAAETRTAVIESVRGAVRETTAYAPQVVMALPTWLRTKEEAA